MRAMIQASLKSAIPALLCFLAVVLAASAAGFRSEPLEIHLHNGKMLHFSVELAAAEPERRQGLMDRKEMAPDHGMLFDFGETRRVHMWMKNTYLPLDMLFISEDGRIEHIRTDTEPLSEEIIDSHGEVRFVLEINAGVSRKLGIAVGDTVSSDQIRKAGTPD